MKGSVVSIIRELTEAHRNLIRDKAEAAGYTALFFNEDEEAAEALKDAEILFSPSAPLVKKAPNLKWVCTPYAGVDQFCRPGVFDGSAAVLTNSSGAYGITISEHAIMTALALLRRHEDYQEIIRARSWKRDLPIRSIYGSRILIAGTGDIGQCIAKRLRGFSPASIIGLNQSGGNPEGLFDRICGTEDLFDLLPETDILFLVLPGTEKTRHLISEAELNALPDQAVVINFGRGSVIDQKALVKQLKSGRLSAGLDVFETEPVPADDPIWNCSNLIMSPHCSGNMTLPHTVDMIVKLFLENFDNYTAGRPLKRKIDLSKGY